MMESRLIKLKGFSDMKSTAGSILLDVLLAMVIFAVGMLALASLQTNLTRSSADSNSRTVAANIGEEIIERMRTFERVNTDPDGVIFSFADIDKDFIADSFPRGNINYAITGTVWGYNYNDEGTGVEPAVEVVAPGEVFDFKRIELTIAWDGATEFLVDGESNPVSTGDMGSGQITIEGVISSMPAFSSGQIAMADEGAGGVPVLYTPGARPDIIRLGLGDSKFKESTTPVPEIKKSDGSTETWFDVITYNSANNNIFLRREEFLVVSCECKMNNGGGTGGFLPTVWNGVEYVTGPIYDEASDSYIERDLIPGKPFGESTSNTPGVDYCVTCCRDHHDVTKTLSSADEVYDPARLTDPADAWTEADSSGDHKHYSRTKQGKLMAVTPGGTYVEACRMVRKDGFLRVAQDFRQEGLLAFPEGYLDTEVGADEYAGYVVNAVDDFYANGRSELTEPDGSGSPPAGWSYMFPGSSSDPTSMPFLGVQRTQQMRSRATYIDHLSTPAQSVIDCISDATKAGNLNPGDSCGAPGVSSYLEVYPFYEVQTTWLSWWNSTKAPKVSVSTDAVATGNTHSRGEARLVDSSVSDSLEIVSDMHRGNLGLAVTDPIGPRDSLPNVDNVDAKIAYDVFVNVIADGQASPAPAGFQYWSGTFESGVNGISAADAQIEVIGENTYCSRSGITISCLTSKEYVTETMVISGYYKNAGTSLRICVADFPGAVVVSENVDSLNKSASLTWNNDDDYTNVILSIESQTCDP